MEADELERHRPLLMGIAYRMLGSAAEAEDAVQDAWLLTGSTDGAAIVDARAWLSTTIVRLRIDRLKSARPRWMAASWSQAVGSTCPSTAHS